METTDLNFAVDRLGACRIASPMSGVQFVGEDERVLYHTDPNKIEPFFKSGKKPPAFYRQDPRPDDCIMDSDKNVYTEDDLRQLEQRIDELIDTVGQLKNENTSLRQQKDKLATERSQLIEKTEMARSRVEAMISRLRSLELGS